MSPRAARTMAAWTHSGVPVELSEPHGGRLRSWTLQKPPIERREYQDNSDVYHQTRPEVMLEEQDVHADHDAYHREHVKYADCRSSHRFVLLCAVDWSKSGRRQGVCQVLTASRR